jgi:hypothetical protein
MSTHRDNFESWYKKVLELLYPHRDAGFPILLITFPLLERYLRQKTCLASDDTLSDGFYDELMQIFPVLTSRDHARNLWQIYRNGLVHEITFSHQTRKGAVMPTGSLSHDKPMITIESDGSIWINPRDFAQHVVSTIESDFSTFEGSSASTSRLPTVKAVRTQPSAADPGRIILGTNTDP